MKKQNDKEDPIEDAVQKCKEEMQLIINKINRNLLGTTKTLEERVTGQDEEIARLKKEIQEVRSQSVLEEGELQPSLMEEIDTIKEQAIWENVGTRLQFSSSFHPQTDGQSEIANSVVLDLLKSYISDQKTQWERYLPLVEFAYNNTIHSSTGKAPFEIVEGAMKVPPFLSTKDKIFEADEYTRDLDTAFAKVRETLQKSQERQKKAADRHRRDLKLKENDWVLLCFEKARLRKKKGKEKLSMRYYGPFQITERINDVSFRLRLPDTWMICISCESMETFGNVPNDGEPDEQPDVEANEEILVPEQILAHKVKTKGKARRQFLIKFKNFPAFDAKWMEEEDLADTP
ncbi:hypothetical protein L7F22_020975 [Adiantum nelumboides]|nr:hypothetical protein [Adiantum nelumboides]